MSSQANPRFVVIAITDEDTYVLSVCKDEQDVCVSGGNLMSRQDDLYNTLIEKVLHKFEPPTPSRKGSEDNRKQELPRN